MRIAAVHRRTRPSALVAADAAALLLAAAWAAPPAHGESAVLTSNGTLYDVFATTYRDVNPGLPPGAPEGSYPVVALRTTIPGRAPTYEIVEGTIELSQKGSPSVEFDEATSSVFVCYMRYAGFMSDLHVAVLRNGSWAGRDIAPNTGLYLSMNPRMVVTRQRYLDYNALGGTVYKWRSILSLVWWEETGATQARYAPIFIEDGAPYFDAISAYNLNEIIGQTGSTNGAGLPLSAYQFPAVQPDPTSNGGVLITFANLANQKELVIGLTFPDDMTVPGMRIGGTGVPEAFIRSHAPIGREIGNGPIPSQRDVQTAIDYFIAPTGRATSWWTDGKSVYFLRNDAPVGDAPKAIVLRPDFNVDRARLLIRDMNSRAK